ncbi:hypothetical protein [Marinobacter psychrophilus]|nr:hypothetical protein [Marinobacter psychrophilus]
MADHNRDYAQRGSRGGHDIVRRHVGGLKNWFNGEISLPRVQHHVGD